MSETSYMRIQEVGIRKIAKYLIEVAADNIVQDLWPLYSVSRARPSLASFPKEAAKVSRLVVKKADERSFGYLTIIDTACPSLSDRVGKVPDSAQRSAASFVLLPVAPFFTGLPE